MKRRGFIALLGGAAAWPLAARAQDSPPVIGYLGSRSEQSDAPFVASFRRGLAESGGSVDKRAAIEFRWGSNEPDRLDRLAAELIAMGPAAILASGGSATALVLKKLTNKIPIVFVNGADPVKVGWCAASTGPRRISPGSTFSPLKSSPRDSNCCWHSCLKRSLSLPS
jgi:putative ABC transport system substrate-binding protein